MKNNDNQSGNQDQDTGTARDECPNHHSAVNGKCKVGWCPYSE